MTKITMLGTGMGTTKKLYNTCFAIQNQDGIFLIDAGGSIEIINRLKSANIKLEEIKNIFISHSHADHILGVIWLFKGMAGMIVHKNLEEKINVYCNDVVCEAIKKIANYTLQKEILDGISNNINFIVVEDRSKYDINNTTYEFFDIHAKGTKQFGFECILDDNRFLFLGDAPLNPKLNERVRNADYVMHEAYCLDSEKDIFHPYEKNHSTALSTAKVMNELGVKNLILYHTEEQHENKKELYQKEAKSAFDGNVIVPNDREEIALVKKK